MTDHNALEVKMNLSNSDVLFLSQVLFHLRVSGSFGDEFEDKIVDLHRKLSSYLANEESIEGEDRSVMMCHDDSVEDCCHEEDKIPNFSVKAAELLELQPIQVNFCGKDRTLVFVQGISKNSIDVDFDGGYEILGDVEEIYRGDSVLRVKSASGWVTIEVEKFTKSWTAILPVGEVCSVEFSS